MNNDPEKHQRIVSDAIKHLKPTESVEQRISAKLDDASGRVQMLAWNVWKKDGFVRDHDAMTKLIADGYYQELKNFTEDEMRLVLCSFLAFNMMSKVVQNFDPDKH